MVELQKGKPESKQRSWIEQLQFIPGIWVNGRDYWLQSRMERVIYEEELTMRVKKEQVHSKIRLSKIYISNHSQRTKEIKVLAMHHHSNVKSDNLAFISPAENQLFHLSDGKVFLVNAGYNGDGLVEHTVVPLWNAFSSQIWGSLEKGILKYQPMAKGPAASVFAMKMVIEPHQTAKMHTWAIAGANKRELILMEQALLRNSL